LDARRASPSAFKRNDFQITNFLIILPTTPLLETRGSRSLLSSTVVCASFFYGLFTPPRIWARHLSCSSPPTDLQAFLHFPPPIEAQSPWNPLKPCLAPSSTSPFQYSNPSDLMSTPRNILRNTRSPSLVSFELGLPHARQGRSSDSS